MTPIRIILIDDHSRVHQAIAEMLDFIDDIVLVGQGSNGQEAVSLVAEHRPDLVLMDVIMPVMGGPDATRAIQQSFPGTKVLALSSFQDIDSVRAMLDAGAIGYVLKDGAVDDLADTIRTAHQGKAIFSAEVAQALLQPNDDAPRQTYDLTERELEVLHCLADGLTHGQIADKLVISQSTVRYHSNNILAKMGVQTRSEAVALAVRSGLV